MAKKAVFCKETIIPIFNSLFQETYQTVLCQGKGEPLYLPKNPQQPYHKVIFAPTSAQSALHEVSHWCLAGTKRRLLEDYGYWYEPDGRSKEKQEEFLKVEARPQALEWIFSVAAGQRFYISLDNLTSPTPAKDPQSSLFKESVRQHFLDFLEKGLPKRAASFKNSLIAHYTSQEAFEGTLSQIKDEKTLPL